MDVSKAIEAYVNMKDFITHSDLDTVHFLLLKIIDSNTCCVFLKENNQIDAGF